MVENKFQLDLSKKEVFILDHGRAKGMLDLIKSIEKRVAKQKKDGKELDLNMLIGEFAIHKVKAKELYSKATQKLSEFKKEK